jgi:hypothetical protein
LVGEHIFRGPDWRTLEGQKDLDSMKEGDIFAFWRRFLYA